MRYELVKHKIEYVDFVITDYPLNGTAEDRLDWWIEVCSRMEPEVIPMSDVTRPQQDPREGKTAILPLVIADMQMRSDAGAKKYGTVLKSDNGRDPLVDAYQEAMDLVMYLRQAITERNERIIDEQMVDALDIKIDPIYTPSKPLEQLKLPFEPDPDYSRPGRFIPVAGDPTKLFKNGMSPFVQFTPTPDPNVSKDGPTVSDVIADGVVVEYPATETILQEAQRLVHGDRGEAYGHPIFDMTRTADQLTGLLRDKLKPGVRFEAEDVGQMMIAVKMSRHRNKAKRDNLTDTAGYAETLSMIAQWRAENPGVDPRDRF